MIPTQDLTMAAEAQALLIAQYAPLPNISNLLKVFVGEVQNLETAFWSYLNGMLLTAQPLGGGNWDILDKYGALVGLPRNGLTDAQYLPALKIQIRANNSHGFAEDIIQITNLVTTGAVYYEWPPAAWEIYLGFAVSSVYSALVAYLHQAKSAGTQGNVRYAPVANIWIWSSSTLGQPVPAGTGLKDSVGGTFPNAPVSLQSV